MIGSDFLHKQYVNQAFEDPIENGVGCILKWKVHLKSKNQSVGYVWYFTYSRVVILISIIFHHAKIDCLESDCGLVVCKVYESEEWTTYDYFNHLLCNTIIYLGTTPQPVAVTTRIPTLLVGNPYKPSFCDCYGVGVDLNYHIILLSFVWHCIEMNCRPRAKYGVGVILTWTVLDSSPLYIACSIVPYSIICLLKTSYIIH